jgi:hypothetical protein
VAVEAVVEVAAAAVAVAEVAVSSQDLDSK